MRRLLLLGVVLAVLGGACSGGSMSETEYVESLNALVSDVGANLGGSLVAYEQIIDPTLLDFVSFVDEQLEYEYDVRDRFESFDPPDAVRAVNQVMVDTLELIIAAAEDLVAAAGDVTSLEELERTPEFAAYHRVNVDADSMCEDVEAQLNDLSTRPTIEGPWIADLQRTVRAFLDCDDTAST